MKKYRETPWMNPKVEIRPSPIHGRGMFPNAPITKGEVVAIWGGNFVSKDEAEEARKSPDNRVQQIDDGVFEVFSHEKRGEDPTYYHNHSCDPNTWMEDEVTLTARRDIKANEELTVDYAMFEANEDHIIIENCHCGSANCRTTITGRDWRRKYLQEQYRNRFSPFINRRIAADAMIS
jgi:SET domain-containing protein